MNGEIDYELKGKGETVTGIRFGGEWLEFNAPIELEDFTTILNAFKVLRRAGIEIGRSNGKEEQEPEKEATEAREAPTPAEPSEEPEEEARPQRYEVTQQIPCKCGCGWTHNRVGEEYCAGHQLATDLKIERGKHIFKAPNGRTVYQIKNEYVAATLKTVKTLGDTFKSREVVEGWRNIIRNRSPYPTVQQCIMVLRIKGLIKIQGKGGETHYEKTEKLKEAPPEHPVEQEEPEGMTNEKIAHAAKVQQETIHKREEPEPEPPIPEPDPEPEPSPLEEGVKELDIWGDNKVNCPVKDGAIVGAAGCLLCTHGVERVEDKIRCKGKAPERDEDGIPTVSRQPMT